MKQVRICENCDHQNDAKLSRCENCGANLMHINPVMVSEDGDAAENTQQQPRSTGDDSRKTTTLQRIKLVSKKDGFPIEIPILGCLIGREGNAEPDYFTNNLNVSREHAKIFLEGSKYFIVDISRNGTMLDRQMLPKGICREITVGSTIVFADEEFLVQEC